VATSFLVVFVSHLCFSLFAGVLQERLNADTSELVS
jgi:hypothetical protein